jgi:UDP-N-acetyl-D-glucosamine dehydrogenase
MNEIIVIGLGYVGLPLAVTAAKNGYQVTGFDINVTKVKKLKIGVSEISDITEYDLLDLQEKGYLKLVNSLPNFTDPSIFVIAVPTPLDGNRDPDLSYLKDACLKISEVISDGSLVINESTSYVGTLTEFIKPIIEKFSKAMGLHFAVAPERIDPGNRIWNLANTPRVIGGIANCCTELAINFYHTFCKEVIKVSSPEVAETTKLLENTFRQVNIALINEIAYLTKSFNISMHEVVDAAATKPFGFMAFRPGIGVGGHCIPVDPVYLTYSGDKNNVEMELVKLSNLKNQKQIHYVLNSVISEFNGCLIGKKIQIVGIAYKKNISDTRESPALELLNELRKLGALVTWHDPVVQEFKGEKSQDLQLDLDIGMIITPHDAIDFHIWGDNKFKVLDFSSGQQILGLPKFF